MFVLYVIALICWVAGGHSAPCENLLRPKDQLDFSFLEGQWVLVLVSASDAAQLEKLQLRDSARIIFGNHSDVSEKSFRRIFSSGDTCEYMQSNVTLQDSGFFFPAFNVTVTVLHTSCPDCAVMWFNDKPAKQVRLYLFSKRRHVERTERDEFKAQAECLNMTEPVVMDPTKELCPDQPSS